MKRSTPLLFLGVLAAFAVTVPVLAASINFFAKAQQWHSKECVKKKPNLERSLLCYFFEKVGEIDAKLADLEEEIDERAKAMRVFDANGKELGPLVDRDAGGGESGNDTVSFFLEQQQRIVHLDRVHGFVTSFIGSIITAHYQSEDCTGTPYATGIPEFETVASTVLPVPGQQYFIIDLGVPPTCVDVHSSFHGSCQPHEETICDARTLIPVTLPFDDPVSLPLQYRFE